MSLDPIGFFSRCQAAFIQKCPLEVKIYVVTASALGCVAHYFLSTLIYGTEKIEFIGKALKAGALGYLLLSTVAGFYFKNPDKPTTEPGS